MIVLLCPRNTIKTGPPLIENGGSFCLGILKCPFQDFEGPSAEASGTIEPGRVLWI